MRKAQLKVSKSKAQGVHPLLQRSGGVSPDFSFHFLPHVESPTASPSDLLWNSCIEFKPFPHSRFSVAKEFDRNVVQKKEFTILLVQVGRPATVTSSVG